MAKNRKKQSNPGKQKLIDAKHRNELLTKIRNSCKTVIGVDLFQLIPSAELDKIFYYRSRPMIAVPEEGHIIPAKIIREIQELINYYIKSESVTIENTEKEIRIVDYYTASLTLMAYCTKLNDGDYKNADKVRSLVSNNALEVRKLFAHIFDKLYDELSPFLIYLLNVYWVRYYSFHLDVHPSKDNSGIQLVVRVKLYQSEKRKFLIEGNVRPAFRIGWTFSDDNFEWLFILPSQLGIKSMPDDQHIPVYIQDHAIRRIFERIDCIRSNFIISSIYSSLRACIVKEDRGKYIFEYKITGVKVGYLSAVMSGGKLVIRTFLFLTFNGTPEGKRLEDFIGLKMLDTKYLKMDKLSSFMTGKLNENQELRAIFAKADCLHLVELHDKLDQLSEIHPKNSPVEMLARYLETERNE
jgi:hypothetical protein